MQSMLYLISGLGADERVFKHLNLHDLPLNYLKWETPQRKENLTDYCKRLISQIDQTDGIILIGVSFGGIVAQEISRIIPVHKIIIISSVKSKDELDWQLRAVKKLGLYKLAPARFLKWSNKLTGNYYFGITSKDESLLLKQIIEDTDRFFMKWAIAEIMRWKGDNTAKNIIHIHGEKDRIFPIKRIKNCIRITEGSHFMMVNKAKEISDIIEKEIILRVPLDTQIKRC